MQRLTYVVFINLAHEETVPAERMVNSRFCLCPSLVPRPMSVVFGLGSRTAAARLMCAFAHHNGQQLQCVWKSLALDR